MKLALSAAIALAALAPAALAQTAPATATAPAATTPAAAKFSLDTPIEQIVGDAAAAAVLEANLPGTATHEAYEMFKAMSLRQVAPYSNGAITDEKLAKLEKELAAIK